MRESAPTLNAPQPRRQAPLRLLLVEDNDDHALLLASIARRSLEPQPQVDRVANLHEAFAYLETKQPDLTLLDLGLPESRGNETLDLVFEHREHLPVVVLTSSSDLTVGEEAVRKGALDFLSKDEVTERSLSRSIRYSLERYKQRLAHAQTVQDLETFAYVAAHDLKSPLCTIQSVCAIVSAKLSRGDLTPRDFDLIDVLKECSEKSTALVDGLLRFCKLGSAAVKMRETSLDTLFDETALALSDTIQRTRAKVTRDTLPKIHCDPGLMAHVFQNLLSNALRFSGPKAPEVHVSARPLRDEIEICMQDRGIGIAEQDTLRIFEPFLRLGTSGDGSGLGLSICKRVVEAHHGRIWAESELGAGSRFFVRLPAG